jgi:hypothetical protein
MLPAALAAIAVWVAGCGGSGTVSTTEYEHEGTAALSPVLIALRAVQANPGNATAWGHVQGTSNHADAMLSKIKPPQSIASLNSQLAASLGAMGAAAGNLSTAISKRDATAARTDVASYRSALQQYAGVISQLRGKGVKFIASGR